MVEKVRDNLQGKHIHSEILTVMLVDLCNYTHLSSKLKRESLDKLHDKFDELVLPTIKAHKGIVIKKIGDSFLLTFKSPTNALHSAIEIQHNFRKYKLENRSPIPIKVKIALHTGEVMYKKGDIYGDAINITSRIESLTKPGDTLFSRSLFLIMNRNEIASRFIGTRKVKGVGRPINLFRVIYPWELKKKRQKVKRKIAVLILLLILFTAIYFILG